MFKAKDENLKKKLPKAQKLVTWEALSLWFQQVLNTSFKNQAQLNNIP